MSAADDIVTIKAAAWYTEFVTMHGASKAHEHLLVDVDEYSRIKVLAEVNTFLDTKTAAEVRAICVELMT